MEQTLNLNFSVADTNVILAGLSELPAKTSYDLINKIKTQAQPQMAPPVAESVAPAQQLLVEQNV
jgi:hypothetical protein